MRHNVAHKDGALHRAAKMFAEYKFHLTQAVYSKQKRTIPSGDKAPKGGGDAAGGGTGTGGAVKGKDEGGSESKKDDKDISALKRKDTQAEVGTYIPTLTLYLYLYTLRYTHY